MIPATPAPPKIKKPRIVLERTRESSRKGRAPRRFDEED